MCVSGGCFFMSFFYLNLYYMKAFIHKYKSEVSTAFGALVAIATAWQSIDWTNFEWGVDTCAKLILSAIIALGGYMTSINVKNNAQ